MFSIAHASMFSWKPGDRPPARPRQEWLPATVEEAFVLWSREGIVIYLDEMVAWPGHFSFELQSRYRSQGEDEMRARLLRFGGDPLPGRLRVGFELADGTRITGRMHGENWPAEEREIAPLVHEGGGGGNGSLTDRFTANFEPPDSDFQIVFEWADKGVPLTRHPMSGERIRDAMRRAERAFPRTP